MVWSLFRSALGDPNEATNLHSDQEHKRRYGRQRHHGGLDTVVGIPVRGAAHNDGGDGQSVDKYRRGAQEFCRSESQVPHQPDEQVVYGLGADSDGAEPGRTADTPLPDGRDGPAAVRLSTAPPCGQ